MIAPHHPRPCPRHDDRRPTIGTRIGDPGSFAFGRITGILALAHEPLGGRELLPDLPENRRLELQQVFEVFLRSFSAS
jgi:hypothetical protein